VKYKPITAYVGQTLNFTAGASEQGQVVVADMGGRASYRACNFTEEGVQNLGLQALVVLSEAGTPLLRPRAWGLPVQARAHEAGGPSAGR